MGLPRASRACLAAAAAAITLALLSPVQAQFWGDWGNRPQRQQQYNNNWGGWGGGGWFDQRRYYDPYRQEREAPVDYSRAPASSQKKPEATIPIYFADFTEKGWIDILDVAVHDTKHKPTILSISWGWAEGQDLWTRQAVDQAKFSASHSTASRA